MYILSLNFKGRLRDAQFLNPISLYKAGFLIILNYVFIYRYSFEIVREKAYYGH